MAGVEQTMQIIIPMSGTGERFKKAGHTTPKPLIEVNGKPIIAHVIDLFPGETDLTFVCNEDHLSSASAGMEEIIRQACPTARIVSIPGHKRGPIHAVLQAVKEIDHDRPVVVNYCDFSVYWDWDDFKSFVVETKCDGAIPAYRGFHPHSLRGGFYAFLREKDLWVEDIQEKKPFTEDPMNEFASSGTYYFRSAGLMKQCMEETISSGLSVGDEFYVSLAYKPLLSQGGKVAAYELQHFMQWGTPEDLHDYEMHSNVFTALVEQRKKPRQRGAVMVPAAGAGSRFSQEGYEMPKPLVEVSGRPMIVQALADLPDTDTKVVILRRDLTGSDEIADCMARYDPRIEIVWLQSMTDGQARTCHAGLSSIDMNAPLTISACDNGLIYDGDAFEQLIADDLTDLLVWGVRGHPDAVRRPNFFGWIDADDACRVNGVSVKQPLLNGNVESDPIVVGTFTFRRSSDFERCFDRLAARDSRVNGEFYVDSLVNDAIALGLHVRYFEVAGYPGWGTPDDLRVFEYWQSCFHKWDAHPYRLERDAHVPENRCVDLAQRFNEFTVARPGQMR